MNIETRDFGNVEITEDEIITFVQPLFGFDQYKNYVLLHDKEIGNSVAWLQSTEQSDICFIIVEPDVYAKDYNPEIEEKDLDDLGDGEVFAWVVCVIGRDLNNSTINLKNPILINRDTKKAKQHILDGDYSLRHPFKLGDE